MDTLMSLPMTASVLTEYGDLEEACRSCGCDGLEVVWGGEELPCTVPQALHVGYHLTFYPDWLDFWRGDRAALTEKFGSEEVWRSFYGGPEGRETLLRLYREDLDRAVTWRRLSISCWRPGVALRPPGREPVVAGLHLHRAELTRRLLDGIRAERKDLAGYRASDELRHQPAYPGEGADYVQLHAVPAWRFLPVHQGDSSSLFLSGEYVRAHTGFLSSEVASDYLKRYGFGYSHILRIDTHQP